MSNKGSNGTLEFKVGDLVYYPSQSLELLKLQQNNIGGSLYPLTLDGLGTFTADGRSYTDKRYDAKARCHAHIGRSALSGQPVRDRRVFVRW